MNSLERINMKKSTELYGVRFLTTCNHEWFEAGKLDTNDMNCIYTVVVCANCHSKKGLSIKEVIWWNEEKDLWEKHP